MKSGRNVRGAAMASTFPFASYESHCAPRRESLS
jgi:hypothetical protein